MSTCAALTTAHYHPRRTGWSPFPIRCPRCHDHGRAERLRDVGIVVQGGGLRCQRCAALLFILPLTRLGVAFIAEVTFDDLRAMEDAHMTLAQSLAYLGAGFPYTETAA